MKNITVWTASESVKLFSIIRALFWRAEPGFNQPRGAIHAVRPPTVALRCSAVWLRQNALTPANSCEYQAPPRISARFP